MKLNTVLKQHAFQTTQRGAMWYAQLVTPTKRYRLEICTDQNNHPFIKVHITIGSEDYRYVYRGPDSASKVARMLTADIT